MVRHDEDEYKQEYYSMIIRNLRIMKFVCIAV
jgi:hypothetical protein